MSPQPAQADPVEAALHRDAAALHHRQQALRQANAEPLPGPLHAAFTGPRQVLGFTLRPVVAGDFILLKQLNSPLYRQTFALAEHHRKISAQEIPAGTPLPATEYQDEECVEMVYQFVVPIAQARADLKRGRDYFRERACATVTDHAPVDALPTLLAATIENFTAAFATAIQYTAPQTEGEETVFTTPAAAGATASAGGSTTSRASAAAIPPAKPSSSMSCP